MWTAKIINKNKEKKEITVAFSDGVHTEALTIRPQDRQGFNHWVQSELASRNSLDELLAEDNLNVELDFTPTVVEPTAEDIYRTAVYELIQMKDELDMGLIEKAEYDAKATEVKALKPAK